MVAHQDRLAVLHHQVEALPRIGPIADHVAQAEDLLDAALADVRQHDRERFEVPVNVADDCKHRSIPALWASGRSRRPRWCAACPLRRPEGPMLRTAAVQRQFRARTAQPTPSPSPPHLNRLEHDGVPRIQMQAGDVVAEQIRVDVVVHRDDRLLLHQQLLGLLEQTQPLLRIGLHGRLIHQPVILGVAPAGVVVLAVGAVAVQERRDIVVVARPTRPGNRVLAVLELLPERLDLELFQPDIDPQVLQPLPADILGDIAMLELAVEENRDLREPLALRIPRLGQQFPGSLQVLQ